MNLFGETHLVLKGVSIITQQSCLHIAMKNYSDRNSINKPVINHYHNDLNQPAELFDVCSTLRIKMKIWVWSLSSSIRICGLLDSSYKWPEVTLNGHRAIHPPTPGGLYASPCLLYWFPQKLKRVFFLVESRKNGVLSLSSRIIKSISLVLQVESSVAMRTYQTRYFPRELSLQ